MKKPKTNKIPPVATPTRIQELADIITLARVKKTHLEDDIAELHTKLDMAESELDGIRETISAACREMDKQTAGPTLPR